MSTSSNNGRFRTFGDTFGKGSPVFLHIADTGTVFPDADGNLTTGAWRPATPSDIGSVANLSVSGLSLTVGAVAVTGNPLMTVSNTSPIPISGVVQTNLSLNTIALTGTPTVQVSNGVLPISGIVQGNFAVNNVTVTGNPQVQISNTAPINISGWVTTINTGNVSLDSTSLVNAQITGNNYLGFISGRELINGATLSGIKSRLDGVVPISGNVNASVSIGAVAVTGGSISINNGVVPISGVVSATLNATSVAVTGGSIAISNGIVPISGVVQAQVSSGPIVDAQASGNALAITANVLLSGISGALAGNLSDVANVKDVTGQLYLAAISGLLSSNLTDAAWVTGAVSISNGVVPISGVVSATLNATSVAVTGGLINIAGGGSLNVAVTGGVISSSSSNPVGVTGTRHDLNSFYTGVGQSTWNHLSVGGRAVSVTGEGTLSPYRTGDFAMFSFNKDNGGLLVNQGTLDSTQDTISIVNSGSAYVSNSAVSGSNTGQVLFRANSARLGWFIQNLHTSGLMIRFGTSLPSTGFMNVLLKGGLQINDGNGGTWSDMPAIYKGPVSVSGFGGQALYTAWEI